MNGANSSASPTSTQPATRSTARSAAITGSRPAWSSCAVSGVSWRSKVSFSTTGGGTIVCGRGDRVVLLGELLRDVADLRVRVDRHPAVLGGVDLDPGRDVTAVHLAGLGDEPEHHPRRESEFSRHQRGSDRILLGVADHRRIGHQLCEPVGSVPGSARRLVLPDAVADIAVARQPVEHRHQPLALPVHSAHVLLEAGGELVGRVAGGRHDRGAGVERAEPIPIGLDGQHRVERVRVAVGQPDGVGGGAGHVVVVEPVRELLGTGTSELDLLEPSGRGYPDAGVALDADPDW